LGIAHLSAMPAIQWKLKNLASLREKNPAKFEEQSRVLAERFSDLAD